MHNGEEARSPAAFPQSRLKAIIWLLCLLASVRLLVFSLAFPFFTNVDEPAHFDLVLKYSRGHIPGGMEPISSEAAGYLAVFNSLAYYASDVRMPPPLWTESPEKMKADAAAKSAGWQRLPNYEAPQGPLYYTLAGLWWNLGGGLGLHDGRFLYWLRFLNIAWMVTAIWLGYAAAKMVFPENRFAQLGVPALIAFLPQTGFYSIGNDSLSPVCFGLAFLFVLQWLRSDHPSRWLGAAMGLAFAATWLAKTTNLPLLAVAGLAVLIKTRQLWLAKKPGTAESFLAFTACAAVPALGWMVHCKIHFGDFTGSKAMTDFFGWTIKPFSEWWHHPIFSPSGAWTYLSGQVGTFWQGEFVWQNRPLFLPGTEMIYTALSAVLLAVALYAIIPGTMNAAVSQQRAAIALSLACFLAALAFFALVSVMYDYHDAPNPSREHPYVREGRLILGALVPFMLALVYGLDRLLKRLGNPVKFSILAGIILAMLAAEVATDWPVFANPFNGYHLP
jgi:Predicted membrane protein (DUF2142)